ncbi:helix-turn-helix domain-containing protein [Cytobacillus oceanisediminis]|uniref:helix-turn-helix domain-containing protein n=1 Tax=Cytobacillus oceanisediminis TaxID=665099 RepID=UPI001FB1E18C|nr:helix-turn-helix transcriptional regulator [Cytobacillus oceanisediminis]UOE54943.1 helix-turn-helix domain-containing protein [Cytobacillus oceanisediminis]
MAIGEEMAAARKRQGITQLDLSQKVSYSRESIAKFETGTRKLPRDMYPTVTQQIDDPEFYFETWGETTGFVSIPYFNGDHIDKHPASMVYLVTKETEEAMHHLDNLNWGKPAKAYTQEEMTQLEKALLENLDAAASMINMVASLSKTHGFSMKSLFQKWQVSLKARKYKL